MTSGNSVESVPDVPQQDNFVDTEPGNTPVQAQVPSRPGTDKMLVVKKGKISSLYHYSFKPGRAR